MASLTPVMLSGGTDGIPIDVTATTSGGANTVHTATATAGNNDEVWLYAYNRDTATRTLSISLGSTSLPIVIQLPPNVGAIPVVSGHRLQNGVIVKVWADVTAKVTVFGNVNRYAP